MKVARKHKGEESQCRLQRQPPMWVIASPRTTPTNLIYFNEVDKGGHFAAWEQPELFTDEIRAAFRSLR